MSVQLTNTPVQKFFDNNGAPLASGLLFTYVAGTSTKQATYIDSTQTTPNTNPIVLNARGECQAWLDTTKTYKFVLSPSTDTDPPTNSFWTVDQIAGSAVTLTAALLGSILYPVSTAEGNTGLSISSAYPSGDVRRFGIVPNNSGAASTNTTALKTLLSPSVTGPVGTLLFPNTTGTDVYYFNGVIPCRDGTHIDLCGSTLNFTGTGASQDTASGMLFALRNFSCQNGKIVVVWATGSSTSSGAAFQFGARASESSYFTVYDSTEASPLGNIELSNVTIDSTVTGAGLGSASAVAMTGGLQNVVFRNVRILGNNTLTKGIYYEFGWATSGTTNLRQTSHAHNLRFESIDIKNLDPATGVGLSLYGAYNASVDGLSVQSAGSVFIGTTGEAMNYRPWVGVDQVGTKHNIALRNLVGQTLGGTAITCTGQYTAASSYLSAIIAALGHPADYVAQTDLQDYTLDGFALSGTSAGYGIFANGPGRINIRNGRVTGFQRNIVATAEATMVIIENVDVIDATQTGIKLDQGSAIWGTPRQKRLEIRDCYIAGSSSSGAGTYYGITIDANTESAIIENCRFGHDAAMDGTTEVNQAGGVFVTANSASMVLIRSCIAVAPVGAGNATYYSTITGTTNCNGNSITSCSGDVSSRGNWLTDMQSSSAQSIAGGNTINISFTTGSPAFALRYVRVTTAGAVATVVLQSGYKSGQQVTIIHEGGAANTITFDVAGTSHVANGVTTVIAGLTARTATWNTGTNLWYFN